MDPKSGLEENLSIDDSSWILGITPIKDATGQRQVTGMSKSTES